MQCEACGHENMEGARFCASCGAILPTPHEGPDPMVGQLVGGRYRVTGVLGEGGMGKVYVGEQQMGSTIRKVAIKTLHAHLSKDPSVLARFHRECGTVAQLEHPNTIKFFDFGSTQDGTLYIAMEFVAGKPLSEVIKDQGPLSSDRVIKIMRQTCGALDEAHLQGIVHRDLKPDNLVLTDRAGETDFVKVLDFGIAARRESADAQKEQKLTQQGMVLGTPPYMSPEQFTGKALDARSDVYSLGVMAYEMLAGKLPFEADTPWQWATQHMTAQPIPFEVSAPSLNVPAAMRSAILKALSKDKEQRQGSAREFFAELSGGARMTVTGDPPTKHSDTAAMPAAPDFSAPAPVFPSGPGPGSPPMHAPAHIPAHVPGTGPAVAVPPAPPPTRGQGGGKGLVIGLGAVGALLLGAMAIVAARSMKPAEEVQPLPIPTSTPAASGTSTTFAPLGTAPPLDTAPVATATTEPTAAPGAGGKPPTSSTGTKPAGTAGGTGKPASGDSCDACVSAARAGNISGAASLVGKCSDAAKKSLCIAAAKNAASTHAGFAVGGGDCAKAQAIAAAARGMGADSPKLNSTIKKGCK
jgi:serine/threonine protein kinase